MKKPRMLVPDWFLLGAVALLAFLYGFALVVGQ